MKRYLVFIIILFSINSYLFAEYTNIYDKVIAIFQLFEEENAGLTTFPTLTIPIGGAVEGMGSAFTALANDSGFLESNPAASSSLHFTELSFLHHNWISDSRFEGLIFTSRFNDLGIGLGGKFLYVEFTPYSRWGEAGSSGIIAEMLGIFNVSYNLFSNYYFNGISFGTNFKIAYRNIPDFIYSNQSLFSVMGDFGILTRFDFLKFFYSTSRNFSIGAAFKNFGFPVKDDPLPTLFTAGIAYSFIRPFTISLDYNIPVSFNSVEHPAEQPFIASGFQIAFTNFLSLQGGIRIKENPFISTGCSINLGDKSFIVNYNLDLSGELSPVDKFSIEVKIKPGYDAKIAIQKKIISLLSDASAASGKGDYENAIKAWEEVLKLDPKFTIVKNFIAVAKKSLELKQLMEEKQNNSNSNNTSESGE